MPLAVLIAAHLAFAVSGRAEAAARAAPPRRSEPRHLFATPPVEFPTVQPSGAPEPRAPDAQAPGPHEPRTSEPRPLEIRPSLAPFANPLRRRRLAGCAGGALRGSDV